MSLQETLSPPGFRFRAGHLALDFTATLSGRLRPTPRELLSVPDDLSRWFVAAGLTATTVAVGTDDLELAHELRESIYDAANARVTGSEIPAPKRASLNRIAALPAAAPSLTAGGEVKIIGPAASLLSLVARKAICLLGGGNADRIRQCASATCPLLFVDTSRRGDRRWCSMSGCGNKAKVRNFRQRHAEGAAG